MKNLKKLSIAKKAILSAMILAAVFFLVKDTVTVIMPPDTRLRVGLMTTTEGIGNATAAELLKTLRGEAFTHELRVDYLEPAAASDYIYDLEALIRTGYELIFCVGAELTEAVRIQAAQYPDIRYIILDYLPETEALPENVIGVSYDVYGAAYLAGAAAANTTQTGRLGVIIGEDTPVQTAYAAAFYAGVFSQRDDIIITGVYIGTMEDAGLALSVANQMYANRADIIFTSAGEADAGVLAAARSERLYAAAADSVLAYMGDTANILVAAAKKYDIFEEIVRNYMNGGFNGGESFSFGLQNGGVELFLSDDISSGRFESIKEKITACTVKIPYNESELLSVYPSIVDFMS
jgi:basic membrane protein A